MIAAPRIPADGPRWAGRFWHEAVSWPTPYADDAQGEFGRLTARAEFTMPPTKVTGSTIAVMSDTVGNLIQITKLDRRQ